MRLLVTGIAIVYSVFFRSYDIPMHAIARELNTISVSDVDNLLVDSHPYGTLDGQIAQGEGILLKKVERGGNLTANSKLDNANDATVNLIERKYQALSQIAAASEEIAGTAKNARMKRTRTRQRHVH